MKKLLVGTFLFISISIFINTILIISSDKKVVSSKNEVNTSSNILSYVVKDFNGNIAIFDANCNDTPIKVIDINTFFLPKADQEMLLKGIKVKDQTELNTLLEDLCS